MTVFSSAMCAAWPPLPSGALDALMPTQVPDLWPRLAGHLFVVPRVRGPRLRHGSYFRGSVGAELARYPSAQRVPTSELLICFSFSAPRPFGLLSIYTISRPHDTMVAGSEQSLGPQRP